jgi:hypothetical protein
MKSKLQSAFIFCEMAQQIQTQENGCSIPGRAQRFRTLFFESSRLTSGLSTSKTCEVSDSHDGDFLDVMLCSLVETCRHFGEMYCLCLQSLFSLQGTLKMNAIPPSEKSVNLYQTTSLRPRRW